MGRCVCACTLGEWVGVCVHVLLVSGSVCVCACTLGEWVGVCVDECYRSLF